MKTTWKDKSKIERKWYLLDASGVILGRLATKVASLLIGKNKVDKVPNFDCGDSVIVVNSKMIAVTGNKLKNKIYFRHSGYPKGEKKESLGNLIKRDSRVVIRKAVINMLPKNKLRDGRISRLWVYEGPDHPHSAQKPQIVNLKS